MFDLFKIKNNVHFRNEWVEEKLKSIESGLKILDAGCGPQNYRKFCSHLEYKSQDFAQYDGQGDGNALHNKEWKYGEIDYIGNIWDIAEENNSFHVILCTEVIEHIPYPNETIKEFSRLLKPKGLLIITAPFASLPHMTPYYYYSGFYKQWYIDMAKDNNMEVVEIVENGNAYDFVGQELNRIPSYSSHKLVKLFLKIYFRIFTIPLLNFLSKQDTKSKEFLTFGYQVVMKKQ
ncbi:MAG: class I SAM-dependent methyltransferase [Sulfurovum sp.]|nr:class I SAM-dependent methyltransferase [Sulfurovum sp.]